MSLLLDCAARSHHCTKSSSLKQVPAIVQTESAFSDRDSRSRSGYIGSAQAQGNWTRVWRLLALNDRKASARAPRKPHTPGYNSGMEIFTDKNDVNVVAVFIRIQSIFRKFSAHVDKAPDGIPARADIDEQVIGL